MKAGINYVLIKSPRTREELMSGIYKNRDGALFISDPTINKPNQSGAHKCQYGTVLHVGELWYDRVDVRSMLWKTTNELQEGDQVVYYYNDDAWNKGRYWIDGEDVYFFIKYENIYFAIREMKIIPVNGYVLVEPIDIPTNFLTDYIKEKSKTYGHVRHMGQEIEETRITKFTDEVPILRVVDGKPDMYYRDLKEGDFVYYPSWLAKPIMFTTQNFIGGYYAQRRFGMWCVIEDPSRITLKENTKHVKHEDMEMSGDDIEAAQREWARIQSEGKSKSKTLYY